MVRLKALEAVRSASSYDYGGSCTQGYAPVGKCTIAT